MRSAESRFGGGCCHSSQELPAAHRGSSPGTCAVHPSRGQGWRASRRPWCCLYGCYPIQCLNSKEWSPFWQFLTWGKMMKERSFRDFKFTQADVQERGGSAPDRLAPGPDSQRPLTVAVCHLEGASCISLGRAVLRPGGLFTYLALFCDLQLASPVFLGWLG